MIEPMRVFVGHQSMFAESDYVQTDIDVVQFSTPPKDGLFVRAYKHKHTGITVQSAPVKGDGVTCGFTFSGWTAFQGVPRPDDDVVDATFVPPTVREKFSHYFKPCPYTHVDVYRVLEIFSVTDPALQHAVKKLLVAGGRGAKDAGKDVQEAIDALERFKEMRAEDKRAVVATVL